MNITLVQCASGRFIDLQRNIAPHHQTYCRKRGYNYLLHYGQVQSRFGPMWDKVILIPFALQQSEMVVWLDSDSLVVDTDAIFEEAFESVTHIGHCKHPEKWKTNFWHYNCGVGFYRKTPETFEFFERVWSRGVVPHKTWQVQATMLEVNDKMSVMNVVDDKWNSTIGTNEVASPVIQSWHGHNQLFDPILARLEEVRIG